MNKMLAWIIGKFIGSKIKLQEGGFMDGSKKWYVSKVVWAGIVTALIGIYNIVGTVIAPIFGFTLPAIPNFIYDILSAIGIYTVAGRVTATQKIG